MGVLMWEAYSGGTLPWSKIEKDAEVVRNVMNSVFLPKPSKCSQKYWEVILKTWAKLPQDRPTFEQLKHLLAEQSYLSEENVKPSVHKPLEIISNTKTTVESVAATAIASNIGKSKHTGTQKTINVVSTNDNQASPSTSTNSGSEAAVQNNTASQNDASSQRSFASPIATSNSVLTNAVKPNISTDMNRKREFLFKVVVIGDLFPGKTALVKRYVHNRFSEHHPATFGVDFALKIVKYDDDTVIRLQLWNIGGQERFGNMTRMYYKEAVGCFIVFDVTRGSTFEAVTKWKSDLDNKVQLPDGNSIPCILLANRCDLVRADSEYNPERLNDFCREQGFAKWFETSAKENTNVQESFQFLVDEIMKLPEESLPDPIKSTSNNRKINATEKPVSKNNDGNKCSIS